jgi:hypothetical protein
MGLLSLVWISRIRVLVLLFIANPERNLMESLLVS